MITEKGAHSTFFSLAHRASTGAGARQSPSLVQGKLEDLAERVRRAAREGAFDYFRVVEYHCVCVCACVCALCVYVYYPPAHSVSCTQTN